MSRVAVVFWSGSGNTEAMANEVADGIKAGGGTVKLLSPEDFHPSSIAEYDAIAFGCPAMGDEELEDTEFRPMWDAVAPSLSGKRIALFGSYGWGDGEWMRLWEKEAQDAGVNLVHTCVIANESPDDEAAARCRELGKTLAG